MLKNEDMNAQNPEEKRTGKNCAEKEEGCPGENENTSEAKKADLDEKSQEPDGGNIDGEEKNPQEKESEAEEKEAESKEEEVDELEKKRNKLQEKLKKENFELKDENNKIMNELKALQDRLSRTMAEYDNFRKRTLKEKEGIYSDACKDILKEILPVLDNLERAVKAEGDLEALKKGVEMTMKQFNTALEKLNVEEIPSEGEFDPNVHNAVMHIEDDNYGKNSVVEVFQKGYKRGDKIIRYSMVKVAN